MKDIDEMRKLFCVNGVKDNYFYMAHNISQIASICHRGRILF